MSTSRSYTPFFASALLMYAVLLIVYPHYQYYIDPDGTAYLTISQRYANGEIQKAINGYWSPWSCWLTAGAIKCGMAAIPASWLVNTIGATGFLYISQSFFLKFNIQLRLQWLLNVTLALFLVYAIFWQSFDDLWECFFLLSALRIMLSERFTKSPILWVTCGIIGALAYFAKAYAFPFFMLNTAVCGYLLTRGNTMKWLQLCGVAIVTMIICSLPWIIALHNKYGIWTTSTAGVLNRSWYLVGHPYYKEGISVMIPPIYSDSPSYWEDPWYVNGATPQFWSSWQLFGRQILKVGHNTLKFLLSGLQISMFFPVIYIVAVLSLFSQRIRNMFSDDARIMIFSFLLFPLAYFLINFESRYIWYMLPLAMVMGATSLQAMIRRTRTTVLTYLFAISFLAAPALGMLVMFDVGKNERELAAKMREASDKILFTGNVRQSYMSRLAYFSGGQYYYVPQREIDLQAFAEDIQHANLGFYLSARPKEDIFRDDTLLMNNANMLQHSKVRQGNVSPHIYKVTSSR